MLNVIHLFYGVLPEHFVAVLVVLRAALQEADLVTDGPEGRNRF